MEHELNDDPFTLGLHVPDNYFKVTAHQQCLLQSENSNAILRAVREFVRTNGLSMYHNKLHTGYVRFLAIRESRNTDDLMVNIVTAEDMPILWKRSRGI